MPQQEATAAEATKPPTPEEIAAAKALLERVEVEEIKNATAEARRREDLHRSMRLLDIGSENGRIVVHGKPGLSKDFLAKVCLKVGGDLLRMSNEEALARGSRKDN